MHFVLIASGMIFSNRRSLSPEHVYIHCEPFLLFQSTGPGLIQRVISKYRNQYCQISIILCSEAFSLLIHLHPDVLDYANFLVIGSYSFLDFRKTLSAIKFHRDSLLYTHNILDHNYGLVMRIIQKHSKYFTVILYEGGCGKTHAQNYFMASKLQHWWRLNILKKKYTAIPLGVLKVYSYFVYEFAYIVKIVLTLYMRNNLLPYFPPLNSTFQSQTFLSIYFTLRKPYLICQTKNIHHAIQLRDLGCDEVHLIRSKTYNSSKGLCITQLDTILSSEISNIIICPSYKYLELLLLDQLRDYSSILFAWDEYISAFFNHFKYLEVMHITLHPSALDTDFYCSIFADIAKRHSLVKVHCDNDSFHRLLSAADLVIGESSSALVLTRSMNISCYSVNPLNNPEVEIFCSSHDINLITLN